MKLLIVNDAVFAVTSMRDGIAWESYSIEEVSIAFDVAEAKAEILKSLPDILLCDIEMPGDNGIELIKWIRDQNFDIDCILLTCHADFSYAKEAVSLGCEEYLLLPVSYETIAETIQKVVYKRIQRLEDRKLVEYGKSWLSKTQEDISITSDANHTPADIVRQCSDYILSHLDDEELNVSQLASKFYLNPVYLNRIFRKEKGTSISQFIIKERMDLAARLLETPNCSVTSVACKIGYPNYSYFSTLFKKHYGCTPSQYKQMKATK